MGKDLTDPKEIAATAATLNLNGADILAGAQTDRIKNLLRENTEKAISEGIFGVPSFVVDEELFWGNDRLQFLCDFLAGNDTLDASLAQDILSRPRGAERKIKS